MNKKLLFTIAFIGLGLILINSTKVAAATSTWSGAVNSLWSNPGNWDTPPSAGDDLIFPNGAENLDMGCNSLEYASLTFDDNYTVNCFLLTTTNGINITGGSSVEIFAVYTLSGSQFIAGSFSGDNLTFSNDVQLNGFDLSLDVGTGDFVIFNGSITGSGNFTKYGSGYAEFNSLNSFLGNLTVGNGTLFLNAENATGPVSNTIQIGDMFNQPGIINVSTENGIRSGSNVNLGNTGTLRIASGNLQILDAVTGTGTLNILSSATLALNPSSDSVFDGNITGTGRVEKNTTNSLTFSADGSFSGNVAINEGTLYVDGNMSDANFELFNSTLAGDGTYGTVSGSGTIAPSHGNFMPLNSGYSITTIPSTVTFQFLLYGTNQNSDYNTVIFGNNTDLNNSTLSLTLGFTPTIGQYFDIFGTSSGSITGQLNGLPEGAILSLGGNYFQVSYTFTSVRLTAVAAPNLSFNSFTVNPTSSTPGQAVTITLVLVGDSGMPTGTVEFFANGVSLGVATINGSGVATLTTSALPTGLVDISAEYSGDGTYAGAVSGVGALSITVAAALANTGINLPLYLISFTLLFTLTGIIIYKKYE